MHIRASVGVLSALGFLLVAPAPHGGAAPLARVAASRPSEHLASSVPQDPIGARTLPKSEIQIAAGVETFAVTGEETDANWARAYSATEKTRRYRALGLPEHRLAAFVDSGLSLTTWYNEKHVGGYGLKVGGAFLVVLGAASLLGAAILAGVLWGTECPQGRCDDDGSLGIVTAIIAIPAAVAGVLELGAGIPMLVVGNRRMRRWAKDGELDRVPIEELERLRVRSRPKASVSLLPYFARGGGGLSFALRF